MQRNRALRETINLYLKIYPFELLTSDENFVIFKIHILLRVSFVRLVQHILEVVDIAIALYVRI